MSAPLDLDVKLASGRFTLEVAWTAAEVALGLFGPSGAGKTTLLEIIAGLRAGARGRIAVAGRTWLDSARGLSLAPERRGVGYVPQDARLFPHRSVLGNILAGHRRAERAGARRIEPERAMEVLELEPLRAAEVGSLSGGERQRVALARALCSGAELLLLDEPLAGLDKPLRRRVLQYLVRVQREFDIPTLHVSHEATELEVLCREALVLSRGRPLAHGRPGTLFTDPAVLPMTWKGGLENVLKGNVMATSGSLAAVRLEQDAALAVAARSLEVGDEVFVAVRADELIVAVERPTRLSAQNVLPGTVQEIRDTDSDVGPDHPTLVFVSLGAGAPLVAAITWEACQRLDLAPGMPVHLVCKAQSCRVLATR